MSRGALRSPLPWLGGLIVVYLSRSRSSPLLSAFSVLPDAGFHVPGLFPSLFVSLESATISLALITLLGVPLAYVLARSPGRLASLIGLVVLLPLALPPADERDPVDLPGGARTPSSASCSTGT